MRRTVFLERGQRPITIDSPIGIGGQGSFCPVVGEPRLGVKLYTRIDVAFAYRLSELIRRRVRDRRLAWPLDRVRDAPGGPVIGVLIERIHGVSGLAIVDATIARKKGIRVRFRSRIGIAREVAAAVDAGHQAGFLFEDLNESNLMVVGSGRLAVKPSVVLIDIDGSVRFICRNPMTGRIAPSSCGVARPEYLPPEVHRLGRTLDLKTVARTESQDVFAVAVLVWQLLTAVHPYSACNVAGAATPQDLSEWIANGWWPWAPMANLPPDWVPNPGAVRSFATFPQGVQNWFYRAFHDGSVDPQLRPSLGELVDLLDDWHERESWLLRLGLRSCVQIWRLGKQRLKRFAKSAWRWLCQTDGVRWMRAIVAVMFIGGCGWLILDGGESSSPVVEPTPTVAIPPPPSRLPAGRADSYVTPPSLWVELLEQRHRETDEIRVVPSATR
jgi:DNA-binding helix-hairpin-helix protein with protein kinase domain